MPHKLFTLVVIALVSMFILASIAQAKPQQRKHAKQTTHQIVAKPQQRVHR